MSSPSLSGVSVGQDAKDLIFRSDPPERAHHRLLAVGDEV